MPAMSAAAPGSTSAPPSAAAPTPPPAAPAPAPAPKPTRSVPPGVPAEKPASRAGGEDRRHTPAPTAPSKGLDAMMGNFLGGAEDQPGGSTADVDPTTDPTDYPAEDPEGLMSDPEPPAPARDPRGRFAPHTPGDAPADQGTTVPKVSRKTESLSPMGDTPAAQPQRPARTPTVPGADYSRREPMAAAGEQGGEDQAPEPASEQETPADQPDPGLEDFARTFGIKDARLAPAARDAMLGDVGAVLREYGWTSPDGAAIASSIARGEHLGAPIQHGSPNGQQVPPQQQQPRGAPSQNGSPAPGHDQVAQLLTDVLGEAAAAPIIETIRESQNLRKEMDNREVLAQTRGFVDSFLAERPAYHGVYGKSWARATAEQRQAYEGLITAAGIYQHAKAQQGIKLTDEQAVEAAMGHLERVRSAAKAEGAREVAEQVRRRHLQTDPRGMATGGVGAPRRGLMDHIGEFQRGAQRR